MCIKKGITTPFHFLLFCFKLEKYLDIKFRDLQAFYFRHSDRVDRLLECTTKQTVMTVDQWHRNQIIRDLWLLAKTKLKMDSCLVGKIS
jgi:hypothetical protein